jgi:hypothetical protein
MKKCRIDGSELIEVLNFGEIYFSNFVDDPTDGVKCELKLGIGKDSGLVQLFETLHPDDMYKKYWYRSGGNESMRRDLKNVVESICKYVEVNDGDTVLDIAANDCTLLGFWPEFAKNITTIGIDPSNVTDNKVFQPTLFVKDFFSSDNYWSVAKNKAKVITSIAMFYDLPDPSWFVGEVKKCLSDDGLWVIQMSYTALMLEQNAVDNICHEHIEYYTLTALNNLLTNHGLKIIDVELNDVNSGSFRAYVCNEGNNKFKLSHHAVQIGEFRTKSLLSYEEGLNLASPEPYIAFGARVEENKKKTLDILQKLKAEGKKVIGYGASTKGNTLLQYYGIGPDLIPCIAERSPEKWGKKTIGTGIPIISEDEMRAMSPDYLFIFPWHFVNTFKDREKQLRASGTRFIVPLPYVYIV